MSRPADTAEALAWDKRKAREYIGMLEEEFPTTAIALRRQLKDYEAYAPSGLYGFVIELAIVAHSVVNR